jgi:hypothetical protein
MVVCDSPTGRSKLGLFALRSALNLSDVACETTPHRCILATCSIAPEYTENGDFRGKSSCRTKFEGRSMTSGKRLYPVQTRAVVALSVRNPPQWVTRRSRLNTFHYAAGRKRFDQPGANCKSLCQTRQDRCGIANWQLKNANCKLGQALSGPQFAICNGHFTICNSLAPSLFAGYWLLAKLFSETFTPWQGLITWRAEARTVQFPPIEGEFDEKVV